MRNEIEIISQCLEEIKREFTHLNRQRIQPEVRNHLVALWEQFRQIHTELNGIRRTLENPFVYPAAQLEPTATRETQPSVALNIDTEQMTAATPSPVSSSQGGSNEQLNGPDDGQDDKQQEGAVAKAAPEQPPQITKIGRGGHSGMNSSKGSLGGGCKILVVDDCENTQNILAFTLKKKGYVVEGIVDPTKAVDKVLDWQPDLILLDLMMPQMDGFEVLKILRANRSCDNIQIIVGSSRSYDKDRLTVLGLGANDFIAKPYNVKELGLRIRNFLSASMPAAQSA